MVGLRHPKILSCHYCGKRSSYRFDGFIKQFQCTYCDAENYLDKNGDITDPPVSMLEPSRSTQPRRWASSARSVSPNFSSEAQPSSADVSSSPAASIFCKKCIQNQHMYQSMLAQYLPDSDSDPEEAELRERNLYKFKRSVEARYPQVCEECRPKVDAALGHAGYKAKADHLRRMMERSRTKRTGSRTWLELVDMIGRALWVLGLLFQLLWQFTSVSSSIGAPLGLLHGEEPLEALLSLARVSEALPRPKSFRTWSLISSLGSLWWNPQFVSTFRGFTRHINGLKTWYAFQAVIVLFRLVFLQISDLSSRWNHNQLSRLLALHAGIALFTIYLYSSSQRAVTKDYTPLFGKTVPLAPPADGKRPHESLKKSPARVQSLSDILDEVLQAPSAKQTFSQLQGRGNTATTSNIRAPSRFGLEPSAQSSGFSLGSLNIRSQRASSAPGNAGEVEEMDWTPTTAHRSFDPAANLSHTPRKLNSLPETSEKRVFWYQVPPQPQDPLTRLRNPLQQPMVGPSPEPGKSETLDTEGKKQTGWNTSGPSVKPLFKSTNNISGLEFAPPKFFAAPSAQDPRNELSGLFGESLTISSDDEAEPRIPMLGFLTKTNPRQVSKNQAAAQSRHLALLEIVPLIGCLAAWVHTMWSPSTARTSSTVTNQPNVESNQWTASTLLLRWPVVILCLLLAGKTTLSPLLTLTNSKSMSRDTGRKGSIKKGATNQLLTYLTLGVGIVEMLVASYCAFQVWKTGGQRCAIEVVSLLGGMVTQRLVYAFL